VTEINTKTNINARLLEASEGCKGAPPSGGAVPAPSPAPGAPGDASAYRAAFESVVRDGGSRAWGRVKLMVVGRGAAGKTSTVRSLLGMAPVLEHKSTEVADITVTRAEGDKMREVEAESREFDSQAAYMAAERVARGTPSAAPPRRSVGERFRKSLPRVLGGGSPAPPGASTTGASSPSASPGVAVAARSLVDDADIAKRFDYAAIKKALATSTLSGAELSFSIWDYGGQEVFYALHHIFLTQGGLFLVVFDMEALLQPQSRAESLEYLRFWLNSIRLHAPDGRVLLVGTRADAVKQHTEVDDVLLNEAGVSRFSGVVKGESLCFFPVNNRDKSASRADALRGKVLEVARKLECVERSVPLAWLKVLDDLVDSGLPFVTYADVAERCARYGVAREGAQGCDQMLLQFHDLGAVVHQRGSEELHKVVVVRPQWLLDKLARVIADSIHVRGKFFDDRLRKGGDLQSAFADLRQSGVATRDLLEVLWEGEQVEYLISFMKETMLLSELADGSLLVASLVANELGQDDFPSYSSSAKEGVALRARLEFFHQKGDQGGTPDLNARFLPKGVFQRLVSQCNAVPGSEAPMVGRRRAVLSFRGQCYFTLRVLGDYSSATELCANAIELCVEPGAAEGPLLVKSIVSMVDSQRGVLFKRLVARLLLLDDSGQQVLYAAAREARGKPGVKPGASKVNSEPPGRLVPLADLEPFFADESALGRLDEYAGGPDQPKAKLAPLATGLKYHVFISHRQDCGADLAKVLCLELQARGLKVCYDKDGKDHRGELNERAMLDGVRGSRCYLLVLTKGVYQSGAVLEEFRTALSAGKTLVLLHEHETHRQGWVEFGHFFDTAPDFYPGGGKKLFKDHESMKYVREPYLRDTFFNELIDRIEGCR
jgi:GTPase SAR1 family protein